MILMLLFSLFWSTNSQSYSDTTRLLSDQLGVNSSYNTATLPLVNQSAVMNVYFHFAIVSIVEINDRKQMFISNGFLNLRWFDEIVVWDPSVYNGVTYIHPHPKTLWRPRCILVNTLDERDIFKDDYSPLVVHHTGHTEWTPGSIFPVACKLSLEKFPFDRQECAIVLMSMSFNETELVFTPENNSVDMTYFVANGEWEIVRSNITIQTNSYNSKFVISFQLKRRPEFFIIITIIPVVLLSAMNVLVFLIPIESGENIGYGITVTLALTVFLSRLADMTPRNSDVMALVTFYLMTLLVMSIVYTVLAIKVQMLFRNDKNIQNMPITDVSKKMKSSKKDKIGLPQSNRVSSNTSEIGIDSEEGTRPRCEGSLERTYDGMRTCEGLELNGNKMAAKRLNKVCLIVFSTFWVIVTVTFLVSVAF